MFSALRMARRMPAPMMPMIQAPIEPTATMPSAPASQPPSTEPTIPTTMLAMMPICALVFMRMLASQPITPPMTRLTIRPMASPFAWEILAGEPPDAAGGGLRREPELGEGEVGGGRLGAGLGGGAAGADGDALLGRRPEVGSDEIRHQAEALVGRRRAALLVQLDDHDRVWGPLAEAGLNGLDHDLVAVDRAAAGDRLPRPAERAAP